MKKNKINLNYAGLFAFSILLIIGFISPIYYYTFLSKDALTSTATWFDIVLDIFSSKNLTYVDFNNIFYLMFFCFFITLILFLECYMLLYLIRMLLNYLGLNFHICILELEFG